MGGLARTFSLWMLLLVGAHAQAQSWGGFDFVQAAAPETTMASWPNLALWLKGSFIQGIADEEGIPEWDDASPNDWDATQDTVAKQPTYEATAFNGKPGVSFDKTVPQYFNVDEASAIFSGSDKSWTVFMVLKWDGTISAAYENVYSVGNSVASIEAAHEWRKNDNTYSIHVLIKDDVPTTVSTSWSHSTFTSQHVYAVRSTGTTMTMYVDGTQVATMDFTAVTDVQVNRMKLAAQIYMGNLAKYGNFTMTEMGIYTADVGTGSVQWSWTHRIMKNEYATP